MSLFYGGSFWNQNTFRAGMWQGPTSGGGVGPGPLLTFESDNFNSFTFKARTLHAGGSGDECPDHEFHEFGREPIGVNQPLAGTFYPFINPSNDLHLLFADFYFGYDDPHDYNPYAAEFKPPFRLVWIYGLGCEFSTGDGFPLPIHDVDLQIRDANNTVVFNSVVAAFESVAWGDRLRIYEWSTATAIVRAVVHTKWPDDNREPTPRYFETNILPENGILDGRTHERWPRRVKSLRVGLSAFSAGNVELVNGYNTTLAAEDASIDGGRQLTQMVVGAEQGSGLGRYPGCDTGDVLLRSVNQVGADDAGGFFLNVGECYRLERPSTIVSESPRIAQITNHTLTFHNDCGPCCSCEDYAEVYKALRELWSKLQVLAERAAVTRSTYADSISRWQSQKDCREDNPLRMAVQPVCPCRLNVAVGVCNTTNGCLQNVKLNINVNGSQVGSGAEVCGQTTRSGNVRPPRAGLPRGGTELYQIGGTYPNFSVHFDSINPGSMGRANFSLDFGDCGANGISTADITLTLDGTYAGLDGGPSDTSFNRSISITSGLLAPNDDGECPCD